MKKPFLLVIFLLTLVYSCKTDFDLIGEWKDKTVVYGILNPSDSVHYIKINKAFLGEGDAYQYSLIPDSNNYKNLDVKLLALNENDSSIKQTIQLDTVTLAGRDSGTFSYPNQLLYKTKDSLNPNYIYKLSITKQSGEMVSAVSPIIGNLNITNIGLLTFGTGTLSGNSPYFSNYSAKWYTTKNGRLYQLTLKIHFNELNIATGVVSQNTLLWSFPTETAADLNGGTLIQKQINGEEFYQFMAAHLTKDDNIIRYASTLRCDFIVDVAGDELTTYMEVSKPSTGLVQEKPTYTNIKNGLGIFSCRFTRTIPNKELTANSIKQLLEGSYTKNLGFVE